MIQKKLIVILGLLLQFCAFSYAQIPTPAQDQVGYMLLKGGMIHVGNSKLIEDGIILVKNGTIRHIGSQADSLLIDSIEQEVEGKAVELVLIKGHVYPGLIAPSTQLGIKEIDRVRASRDNREVGFNNAHVRSLIAYNTESKILPTVKYNGILIAEIAPQGGVISGQSSVVELDAWNWEDAAYKTDVGIHIQWPVHRRTKKGKEGRKNQLHKLREIFDQAQAYAKNDKPAEINLKYEAMKGMFRGEKKAFVHASKAHDILEAIEFMHSYGISIVIVGGAESFKIAGLLRDKKVPVVLVRTQRLPSHVDSDYDESYRTPKILLDSGVLFCIADEESWQQRNLPFQAGSAVAFGLDREAALSCITQNTAEIYGLDQLGTLEVGKDATLVISEGDILDMRSNTIKLAMIRGKRLDMTNHQQLLYKKYEAKYAE